MAIRKEILDEHKHGAIYAKAFHFPRDFTVIGRDINGPARTPAYTAVFLWRAGVHSRKKFYKR
jgi:hypothetical protein